MTATAKLQGQEEIFSNIALAELQWKYF